AGMIYKQYEEKDVNPARLLNAFTESEEQREVAGILNKSIPLASEEEQNHAFFDALFHIKKDSIDEQNKTWDPTDLSGLQKLVQAKKDLENLGKKRQTIKVSFHE
ncbi:MAG: DNA primase, partial [Eubacteriales bacterium]|nr:DNA primase [Eubacteriales bacterium]